MQEVPSTYHQCLKFPFNGTEVVVPGDNSISIDTLSIAETLVPNNCSSSEPTPSLTDCAQKMKMMSLGMGEYTLDSMLLYRFPLGLMEGRLPKRNLLRLL